MAVSQTSCEPMFINGEWTEGTSGKRIPVYDPSTEEVIAEIPDAGVADIDKHLSAFEEVAPALAQAQQETLARA